MRKIILFNEAEEFYQFPSLKEAAQFLGCEAELLLNVGEGTINDYYVEFEDDRIVQYNMRTPIRIWDNFDVLCDTLLMHPTLVSKSLTSSCIAQIHFKWFSDTKGKHYNG